MAIYGPLLEKWVFKTAEENTMLGGKFMREELYKNNQTKEERLLTIEDFKNCKKYSWSCCGSSTKNPNHICYTGEGCYFSPITN
jgi:hypothetical protein